MGRRRKKMTLAEAMQTATIRKGAHTATCARCPKWRDNYCSITARQMVPAAQACAYGKKLSACEYQAEYRKAAKAK